MGKVNSGMVLMRGCRERGRGFRWGGRYINFKKDPGWNQYNWSAWGFVAG